MVDLRKLCALAVVPALLAGPAYGWVNCPPGGMDVVCSNGKTKAVGISSGCDPSFMADNGAIIKDAVWVCWKKAVYINEWSEIIGVHTNFCLVDTSREKAHAKIERSSFGCEGFTS